MATGNNDNDVDGDGVTGNKVDADGDGSMGDDNDDNNDNDDGATATARWAAARRDTTTTTMATGDDDKLSSPVAFMTVLSSQSARFIRRNKMASNTIGAIFVWLVVKIYLVIDHKRSTSAALPIK